MKNIVVVVMCFICACNSRPIEDCNTPYTIDIWDSNSITGYSVFFQINTDSLIVNSFTDGTKQILVAKALTQTDRNFFCNYLSSFNIDTLQDRYKNPSVDDGTQEVVILKLGTKKKRIEVSNTYQQNIAGLFDMINIATADEKYKIKYKKP
jgi:hypothetical protein